LIKYKRDLYIEKLCGKAICIYQLLQLLILNIFLMLSITILTSSIIEEVLKRIKADNETLDNTNVEFPADCIPELESRRISMQIDVLEAEDNVIEDFINLGVPYKKYDITYVKYDYLRHITNGFHSNMKIGKGGFSEVFKGVTMRSNVRLAIKKLDLGHEEANELVNLNVDTLPRLRHQNIIDLYGYSNDDDTSMCLIYPFMENGTLKGMLKHDLQHQKYLKSKQRLDISKGIAAGICYIHNLHIDATKMLIHRDINTSNILLDINFTPKIRNFGLIKLIDSGDDDVLTYTEVVYGTPAYMPPEAFLYECSAKWDVWSFGVVLLEILTSLPVIDNNREEKDIVTHVNSYVEDNGDNSLNDLLDPCWHKDDKLDVARAIYELTNSRCLVASKKNRANSEEIVQKFKNL